MDEFLSTLTKVWPAVPVLASAAWTVWVYRQAARKEGRREDTELIKVAQDAAKGVIEELRAELNRQNSVIDELRQELDGVRKVHIEMVEAKDATIAVLSGKVNALEAENEALRRLLRKVGVEPPPSAPAHFEVRSTAISPASEPLP